LPKLNRKLLSRKKVCGGSVCTETDASINLTWCYCFGVVCPVLRVCFLMSWSRSQARRNDVGLSWMLQFVDVADAVAM